MTPPSYKWLTQLASVCGRNANRNRCSSRKVIAASCEPKPLLGVFLVVLPPASPRIRSTWHMFRHLITGAENSACTEPPSCCKLLHNLRPVVNVSDTSKRGSARNDLIATGGPTKDRPGSTRSSPYSLPFAMVEFGVNCLRAFYKLKKPRDGVDVHRAFCDLGLSGHKIPVPFFHCFLFVCLLKIKLSEEKESFMKFQIVNA